MIIKAIVRLQDMPGSESRAFVARGARAWGEGELKLYQVTADSWGRIAGVLKTFGVIGANRCRRGSVESYTQDIGTVPARLEAVIRCTMCRDTGSVPSPAGCRPASWPCPACNAVVL